VINDEKLQLELLELPREGRTPGPNQAKNAMTTDEGVRERLTFLQGQGQAQIVYANLLSLPFGNGLLYVQPVYVRPNNANAFPLNRLVLVSYGTQVGYGDSLAAALADVVRKGAAANPQQPEQPQQPPPPEQPQQPPALPGDVAAAAAKIQAAIDKLQAAQQAGDFAAYGAALAELNAAVEEFEAAQQGNSGGGSTSPSPTPSPTG
jgi:hypothetical protein